MKIDKPQIPGEPLTRIILLTGMFTVISFLGPLGYLTPTALLVCGVMMLIALTYRFVVSIRQRKAAFALLQILAMLVACFIWWLSYNLWCAGWR